MIVCTELFKRFGDVKAVDGVSIRIPDGTFLGLLGPNGAGKTTLVSLMTGLLIPDSGSVTFDGRSLTRNSWEVKASIGVVSQHINLDKELTVEENMEFSGRLYRMKKSDIVRNTDRLLSFLGLEEARKRPAQNLSGGMKRKLMIARAMLHNPSYLFLDEPTVGIDPNSRRDIWDFLKSEQRNGKTIVLTSHYIEEIQRLCSQVAMISSGRILKENSPQALIDGIGSYKVEYNTGEKVETEFFPDFPSANMRAKELDFPSSVLQTNLEDVFFRLSTGE